MIYLFDKCELDTDRLELRRDGEIQAVQPQVFSVLLHLIENREHVVSKDELIDAVWEGRVISDTTLTSRINAARRAVGDNGKEQAVIRTFPRRGFRFVAAIETQPVQEAVSIAQSPAVVSSHHEKPSLVVLPLRNISGDPEQEYFADGITEDLTAALAKFSWFSVIGRNTAFIFKNEPIDARKIGTELDVGYVLEGSLRRSGKQLRVTAGLIETEKGKHIWTNRYDRKLTDIFEIQDEIASNIARAIEPELTQAEGARLERKTPNDFTAWDYALRAQMYLYRHTSDDIKLAIEYADKSVSIDPKSAFAYRLLATSKYTAAMNRWFEPRGQTMAEALEAAGAAVGLDPRDASAHHTRAMLHLAYSEHEAAISAFDVAIELNSSLAHAYAGKAATLTYAGRPREALPLFDEAIRVSPLDPNLSFWRCAQALTYLMVGDHERAVDCAQYSIEHKKTWLPSRLFLIATLAYSDQLDLARREIDDLLAIEPKFDIAEAAKLNPFKAQADLDYFLEGLRAAGLPE